MRESFCFFLFMLHFTEGCVLSDHTNKEVTGYTGGSVLLPCSCTDPQTTVETFIWTWYTTTRWIKVFEDETFKGRLKLFNESNSANLSLLISDLRQKDEGLYRCESSGPYTDFTVKIKGCDLNTKAVEVTGHSGGSVVLPCSCTELQAKPPQLTWTYTSLKHTTQHEEMYPNEQSERHRGRVKLLNESSPGNLSLLIPDLRQKDEGLYRCDASGPYTDFTVKIKGCDLNQNTQTVEVTGHSGGSVVLPCSCTELQDKPSKLTWTYASLKHTTQHEEIYPNEQSERHRRRVKLLNESSPGNLSLQISNLTTEDQGEYHCSVLQTHINITLTVQGEQKTEDKTLFFLLSLLPVIMLLAVLALIYWKCRGRRDVKKMTNDELVLVCSEKEKQDEVTYSSVVHVKTAVKPAHKQTIMAEHSEYASIK